MKNSAVPAIVVGSTLLFLAACSLAVGQAASPAPTAIWPTKSWPKGTPASVGLDGLYLNDEDLAKIGFLYLNGGVWEGTQIVSEDWVKQSVAPHASSPWTMQHPLMPWTVAGDRIYYGFTWWVVPVSGKFAWMGFGLSGQRLMVFPEQNLIAVFTAWELLNDEADAELQTNRLLPAVKAAACPGTAQTK